MTSETEPSEAEIEQVKHLPRVRRQIDVRLTATQARHTIEMINNKPVYCISFLIKNKPGDLHPCPCGAVVWRCTA